MPRNSPRQVIWLLIVLIVAAALWYQQRPRAVTPVLQHASETGAIVNENHYSPAENLEQLDLAQIDNAKRSLDIAMYAFTDRFLAEAVVRAARRGVQVRIYRDHDQFEDEQRHQGRREEGSTAEMFRGESSIQVRVKASRELMHLKAYCIDGALLRDGSANWSNSGLKRQDNNARFTTDRAQVGEFENNFAGMWARDNQVVQ
ncbi:MAG: phospholipase D-like domain-containing protein [Terriglobales bacterium]|jgi:phosphatidylserine/phosphatidylglycerophosphate/cardiolipin synthase-like enzyme